MARFGRHTAGNRGVAALDRYCLGQIAVAFLLAVGTVSSIVLFQFTVKGLLLGALPAVRGLSFLKLAARALLASSSVVIPASLLVACVIVSSRLRADGEWVAFLAAGASPGRIARPFLAAGLLGFAFTLIASHRVEPRARQAIARMVQARVWDTVLQDGLPATSSKGTPYLKPFVVPGGERRLAALRHAPGQVTSILLATPRSHGCSLEPPWLRLDLSGVDVMVAGPSGSYQRTSVDRLRVRVPLRPPPGESANVALSSRALLERAENRKRAGKPFGRVRLELEKRYSFPAACLGFALLGLPLGVHRGQRHLAYGFLVSAALLLVYYAIVRGADALADPAPTLARWLLWSPDVAMVIGALAWRRRQSREVS